MDTLSDDSLLEIFDFYRLDLIKPHQPYWKWHTLVHVCRRWRQLIFASPRRLELQLLCRSRTPVRRILDCWPPLPLVINDFSICFEDEDDLAAALEHPDRISKISLRVVWRLSDTTVKMLQQPFPALTYFQLSSEDTIMGALPDAFLGGYSPRLLELRLKNLLFPSLPKLLSSTSDLVELRLTDIPITGRISPEVMADCLSMLPKLKLLSIKFKTLIPFPNQRSRQRPSLLPRAVLPTLTTFSFKGDSEYLEELVFRIDAPLLVTLSLELFDQLIIDIRQLSQFISRTENFGSLSRGLVKVDYDCDPCIYFRSTDNEMMDSKHRVRLSCSIVCYSRNKPISSMAHICNQLSPILFNLKSLWIRARAVVIDDTDLAQWYRLFRPFTALETLYVCALLAPDVAHALEDLSRDSAMALLPKLRWIQFESSRESTSVNRFVTARELSESGHHITVEYVWSLAQFWNF